MILDNLFQLMAKRNASDIFISAGAPINIKIHGNCSPINRKITEPAEIQEMVHEILTPEQIEAFTENREMNLSVSRKDIGNFRVSLFWQRGAIALVVRFITTVIPHLDQLALPSALADIIMAKRGLVLITGATGSGKSTTIAAMLEHRNLNMTGHILTVEDPIEFLFQHRRSIVNQREIGIDTRSWGEALKNAMRQAPDCIMIGEIRDRETMEAAIAYAQTGHLCLSTLHANNAYHALNRIINFFPLENRTSIYLDLSVTLRAIVSQRLVHKLDGRRTPAVELLINTRHIAELIEKGAISSIKEAMEQNLVADSRTFEQDLYHMYKNNIISFDEALTNADSPTNLAWMINNEQSHGSVKSSPVSPNTAATGASATSNTETSFAKFTLDMDEQ
jgi:twitching motility protein PilU